MPAFCAPDPSLASHAELLCSAALAMAPKTYLACVEASIVALKESEGSSRQAITKYIKATHGKDGKI